MIKMYGGLNGNAASKATAARREERNRAKMEAQQERWRRLRESARYADYVNGVGVRPDGYPVDPRRE